MPDKPYTTTVNLPVKARLVLLTVDDREVPVTPEILKEFTRDDLFKIYDRFKDQFVRALGLEPGTQDFDGPANTIREMVECALFYDHDFDYSAHPDDPKDEDAANARHATAELRALFGTAS